MNVVDSSGWLEHFADGKNAGFFFPVVTNTDDLVVPSICIYEVFKRLSAQRGEDEALKAIGVMSLGTVVELTQEIAISAAAISAELKLAMADSIILATARAHSATLWTQDKDFEVIEDVRYIPKE